MAMTKGTSTKTTTPRKRSASKTTGTSVKVSTTAKTSKTTAKPRAAMSKKLNDSLVARTGRTIKERPYTSAAIATGAVTVVAAAAAGAFLMTRRDKSFKEASGELTSKVKDGLASASETVKDGLATATEVVKDGLATASVTVKSGIASATETVKDLGQRGTEYFNGDSDDTGTGTETRTQQQIAEEALTLKETGAAKSSIDTLSATEIKTGAVSY